MKNKAVFYHAGCPVCVNAEQLMLEALDKERVDLEIVHLGNSAGRLGEAKALGIKSVPALAMDGQVYHINFGANLSDLG